MEINYLTGVTCNWNEEIPKSNEFKRNWKTNTALTITLSDGHVITIPKGYIWDGASVPKWLWWLFKPIDEAALGDLIHDYLWGDKQGQFEHFNYNIYKARKFADDERLRWRNFLAPKKKIKNYITHYTIRLIGGFFYSQEIKIPT